MGQAAARVPQESLLQRYVGLRSLALGFTSASLLYLTEVPSCPPHIPKVGTTPAKVPAPLPGGGHGDPSVRRDSLGNPKLR